MFSIEQATIEIDNRAFYNVVSEDIFSRTSIR